MSVEWWKEHSTKEWEWATLTRDKQKELVSKALDVEPINIALYSFRDTNEPEKRKILKTALLRVELGAWQAYYPRSGRNGMISKLLPREGTTLPDLETMGPGL